MWEIKKFITNEDLQNEKYITVARYKPTYISNNGFPVIEITRLISWIEETDDDEWLNPFSFVRLQLIEWLEYYSYSVTCYLHVPEDLYSYLLFRCNLEGKHFAKNK